MTNALTAPQKEIQVIRKPMRLNKRQRLFFELWLGDPNGETYGNAYQSALLAGFKDNTARIITTQARNLKWVQEGLQLFSNLEPEHIFRGIQQIALSSAYDRDKLSAYALMAKIKGMTNEHNETTVNVKFLNSVPRPTRVVIDQDSATPSEANT